LIFIGGWQNGAAAVPLGFANQHRENELDADAHAVEAMATAGYDPAALESYIARVQPASTPRAYPERDERLAAIRAAIEKLPTTATYSPQDRLAAIQDEVRRMTVTPPKAPPRLAR
jgi:predicted Zn-dependent protease